MTRVVAEISVGAPAVTRADGARCITAERSSCVISAYSTATSATPGTPATFDWTSLAIWPRSGQAAVVSATFNHDVAIGCDRDVAHHAQVDDRSVKLRVEYPREDATDVLGAGRGGTRSLMLISE